MPSRKGSQGCPEHTVHLVLYKVQGTLREAFLHTEGRGVMTCIKTGAQVYFENYGFAVPADIYEVGDCYVVRWSKEGKEFRESDVENDWVVMYWVGDAVWHREDLGVSVVPKYLMMEGK